VDRTSHRKLQHLYLQVAATNVHIGTVGSAPDPRDIAKMIQTLDNVAHAMAMIIPIFSADSDNGKPVEIPAPELLSGRFSRGARYLTTSKGKIYRGLSVQRGDMEAAIAILNRTRWHKI
jgi:hypothetical protein